MGVCNNCGNQISDGQLTCPVCGAYTGAGAQANNQTPQQNMYNQQGMYNQAPQQNMYNQQGMYNQAPQQNMYNQQDMYIQTPQQPQKELGMKWFHFVIYFQLFVSALVGLWNGFQLLTGRIYGENTDRVYSYFSGLKGVDTIIGICYIASAIFALVTRFMLADFKKCGPAMYIGMQVAGLIISIAYIASVTSIVDGLTEYIASSTYGTMAVSIVMLICNIVYFKKRKHLFDR